MKTVCFSAGGIVVEVQIGNDGSFRLKRGETISKLFKSDQIGFVQSDGVTIFYGHNEQTGLLPGVPYIGLLTTRL